MSWNPSKLTWLITGASSGFGLAITRLAVARGDDVIATSRNPSRNPDLVAEVERSGGQWHALDVDDPGSGSLIHQLERTGVAIDVFVSCAGWARIGIAECFSESEVRAQMETCYFGPYRLIRAVVPYMRERRRGMVVNISSGAGVDGRETMGSYGASKAALDSMVRVMAKELAPFNIRCLTVELGAFDTPFASSVMKMAAEIPQGYKGSASEFMLQPSLPVKLDGDHLKASQAIVDVILGEGVGAGKESARILPLGRNMWAMLENVRANLLKTMDDFGHICNNVYRAEQ